MSKGKSKQFEAVVAGYEETEQRQFQTVKREPQLAPAPAPEPIFLASKPAPTVKSLQPRPRPALGPALSPFTAGAPPSSSSRRSWGVALFPL